MNLTLLRFEIGQTAGLKYGTVPLRTQKCDGKVSSGAARCPGLHQAFEVLLPLTCCQKNCSKSLKSFPADSDPVQDLAHSESRVCPLPCSGTAGCCTGTCPHQGILGEFSAMETEFLPHPGQGAVGHCPEKEMQHLSTWRLKNPTNNLVISGVMERLWDGDWTKSCHYWEFTQNCLTSWEHGAKATDIQ